MIQYNEAIDELHHCLHRMLNNYERDSDARKFPEKRH